MDSFHSFLGCLSQFIIFSLISQASSQKTYRVSAVMGEPFIVQSGSGFSGYIPDMLENVGKRLNITFAISAAKDGKFGDGSWTWTEKENANWTGMIGHLIRNESDIAAASLWITAKRANVIQFSQPYLDFGLRILYLKPGKWQEMEDLMVVLSPLRPEVWIIGLVLVFVVSVLLTLIGKFSPWEQIWTCGGLFDLTSPGMTFPNSLLFSFGSLMWQGLRGTPRSVSGRTLACFWWMFAMFFLIVYGANLTAFFLTREPLTQSVPFSTFDELVSQTKIKYGFIDVGYPMVYFKNSKLPVDKRIYQAVTDDVTTLVTSFAEGVERVKQEKGNYAYIDINADLELAASRDCELIVLGEVRDDMSYGFACRKELTICRDLDVALLQMKADQTLNDLKQKWFSGPCMDAAQHEIMWNGIPYADAAQKAIGSLIDEKAVTLKRFGAPLILLLIGAVLSLAILGVEILWVKRYGEPKKPTTSIDERSIRDNVDMTQ